MPSGRTANWVSSSTDERLEAETRLSSVAGGMEPRFDVTDGSGGFDGSLGSSDEVVSSRSSGSGGEIVYVGWRLTKVPRFGTKREFWTFVRVDKAAISGSGSGS